MASNGAKTQKKGSGEPVKTGVTKTLAQDGERVWKGYITFELATRHKTLFQEWAGDVSKQDKALWSAIARGCKLNLRYDGKSGAYVATLYDTDETSPVFGYSLPARASEPAKALARLLFIDSVIFSGEWVVPSEGEWDDDIW